ncbi:MAG TPA: response regulator [bacterium]|nr:response regulator [bacterium]HOL48871.1 response regulator [bacterium]HPQ19955.1 response regulator [bacterium]
MANFLLADDDKFIEKIIRFKLEKEGHTLDYAVNGEEALNKLTQGSKKYDIIILDIMMPVCDGLYTLKKIREINEFKNTPIIILSTKNREEDIILAYELGATEYIIKPFSPYEFYVKIKKYLT